ncbi:glycosyl transferase [Tulasnella sp. 419]|nr:glycosyl transferase [Tulasnella sp. 419]
MATDESVRHLVPPRGMPNSPISSDNQQRKLSFSSTISERLVKDIPAEPKDEPLILPGERDILVLSTLAKLLLFPSYRSTDFEVHRNWLAITHSLPLVQWYRDTTSEWTLDYPPFFAHFEWFMSLFAALVDSRIVEVKNLKYDAWSVVAFQRATVILTELVMGFALLRFIRGAADRTTQTIVSLSLFLHPSFIIVDHIHFQYNGFMFGILLWSILMVREGNKLLAGLLFAILLNFKHLYMYLAPAYFVYLLRSYCLSPQGQLLVPKFVKLATVVLSVFAVSFGPFALLGQIPQVFSRLFPFTRGLNHAYWAPNAWALVTALDRVLLKYGRRFGFDLSIDTSGVASTSRGLVGDTVFAVIPNVKPIHTFAITVAFQMIFLVKLWRIPTYKSFVCALTLCGYSSYMFGWHVHEKAVMMVLVPLSILATENNAHFRTFVIATIAGVFSLFPLLFTPQETPIKLLYSVIWGIVTIFSLRKRVYEFPATKLQVLLDLLEKAYLLGFPLLQMMLSVFHFAIQYWTSLTANKIPTSVPPLSVDAVEGAGSSNVTQMEFLPLMVTSVYCAIGLCWAFIRLGWIYLWTY